MVNVLHVPAFQDNYIWLIRAETGAGVAIVDPGEAAPVIQELERTGLRPVALLCTHHHNDHVGGAAELAKRYCVPVYGPANESIPAVTHPLKNGSRLRLAELGVELEAIETPGHTRGQINYYGHKMLFSGDTLFSAGCGRLFEGSADQMHASLSRLAALPEDTKVYCGHEYTEANLRFALAVEPDNRDAREHLDRVREQRARKLPSLPSTIGLERRINPFLRSAVPAVKKAAETQTQHALASETEVFAAVRKWKDGFRG